MGWFKRKRHEHDWYIVHHTDHHDHHWCPTGFMMCRCAQVRKATRDDPVCEIPAPNVVEIRTSAANNTVSSTPICVRWV